MTPRSTLRSKTVLTGALGAGLTAVLAGGVAWAVTGSTATLSVDGTARTVEFRGGTVADVLDAAGLRVGAHDVVVPAVDTRIGDGETVSLRRGRQLQLVVDGRPRTVWTTAGSVDEALRQVGLRSRGLALSASRSRGIPLGGLSLSVRTPKAISILADNRAVPLTTTAPTVRDALIEAGVRLDADDRLSHPRTAPVTKGLVVRVTRVRTVTAVERVPVPFGTERREDPSTPSGTTRTLTAGRAGVAERTVRTTYADARVEARTVTASRTVTAPVTRVLAVGTGARPAAAASSQAGPRRSTGDVDRLNWPALAQCESGGNPRAVSSSGAYRGLYQFSFSTWRGVGGSGDPAAADPGEQTYRAKLLYQRSGAGQWPVCGRRLFS